MSNLGEWLVEERRKMKYTSEVNPFALPRVGDCTVLWSNTQYRGRVSRSSFSHIKHGTVSSIEQDPSKTEPLSSSRNWIWPRTQLLVAYSLTISTNEWRVKDSAELRPVAARRRAVTKLCYITWHDRDVWRSRHVTCEHAARALAPGQVFTNNCSWKLSNRF